MNQIVLWLEYSYYFITEMTKRGIHLHMGMLQAKFRFSSIGNSPAHRKYNIIYELTYCTPLPKALLLTP